MVDDPGASKGPHGTGVIECRYDGRDFTAHEMELLRSLITQHPTRAAIARAFCRKTGWYKPDGGLKNMMASVTFLAMHRATQAPSTRRRVGSMSAPPRGADATIRTGNSTNQKKDIWLRPLRKDWKLILNR